MSITKDRPTIRLAVTLMSEDNGGHLLSYYGASDLTPAQVVSKMIEIASVDLTESDLDAIEEHLQKLSPQDLETLAIGDVGEGEKFSTPLIETFLNAVFEADVL